MPRTYTLYKADNPAKKYKVYVVSNSGRIKKVQFGAAGMSDYTKHKDKERKQRYINRHKSRENWKDPTTAGFWSLWVLWNLPSVNASLADVKRRFRLKSESF
jgi:Family of unknown function (DUF5754)